MAIYRYVTEGSFDAYMWQALETKARFIGQVITGDNAARRAEDIGGQELSYAEVKAIASGNPAVLTLAEADAELQRLTLLKKNHLDEQYVARRSVRDLPATIASLSERLTKLGHGRSNRHGPRRRPDHHQQACLPTRGRARRPGRPARRLAPERPRHDPRSARHLSGPALRHGPASAIPARCVPGRCDYPSVHAVAGAPGAAGRPERPGTAGRGYGSECDHVRQDLAIAESQLRDYQARLGKPFLHDAYLSELTTLRDQLKAGLSGTTPEPDGEEQPAASELAQKIKALKAAHSIEATPQRIRQKHSSAEEPVTARIRRRREAVHASDPAARPDAAASVAGAAPLPAPEQDSATKREMTFQERLTMEQQGKDQQPSLP